MSLENETLLQTQLNRAISNNDTKGILRLVQDENLDVNERDIGHDLLTVLMKVCYLDISTKEVIAIIHEILERDPDVNTQDSLGRTAVMHACTSGRSEIADCLISDPDTLLEKFDFDGNSVLTYAIQSGSVAIVKRILEHPNGLALLSVYNCHGESPLTMAEKDKNSKIHKLVCSFKKGIPNQSSEGLTKRKKHQTRSPNLPPTFTPRCEKSIGKRYIDMNDQDSSTHQACGNLDSYQQSHLRRNKSKENVYGSSERISLKFDAYSSKQNCKTFNSCEKITGNGNENLNSTHALSKSTRRESFRSSEGLNELNSSKFNLPAILLNRKEKNHFLNSKNEHKLSSRMKERRNSWSLPDLRDITGCLVASGNNTPQHSDSKENSANEISDEEEDDNVFATTQEIPKPEKVIRKCKSELKIKFPKIPVKRTLTETCVLNSNKTK